MKKDCQHLPAEGSVHLKVNHCLVRLLWQVLESRDGLCLESAELIGQRLKWRSEVCATITLLFQEEWPLDVKPHFKGPTNLPCGKLTQSSMCSCNF